MNTLLFDADLHQHLLPLTYTRPVAELRVGILRISEKWEQYLGQSIGFLTEEYLSAKFPAQQEDQQLVIHGGLCPNRELLDAILQLSPGQQLVADDLILAQCVEGSFKAWVPDMETQEFSGSFNLIDRPWKIFGLNAAELEADFELITAGRESQPLSDSNKVIGDSSRIFLEEGAEVEAAILNTKGGSIYIGKNAVIMEGALIKGGLALLDHAQLKLGAKIYGATTIGPHSKVGGEVNNSVITGYSNKGHDGFLGNAVLGEWCNIGADTNNSNLKNNYDQVRLWSYATGRFAKTGLQFCGLIMGDHSKCGINTMFNTGTVVGVSANVFGSGFPRNFIPSYSWGGASGFSEYNLKKALDTAERVMQRRGIELDEVESRILTHIFELSSQYR